MPNMTQTARSPLQACTLEVTQNARTPLQACMLEVTQNARSSTKCKQLTYKGAANVDKRRKANADTA